MKKFGLLNGFAMSVALSACATTMTPDSITQVTKRSATIDVRDIDYANDEGVEVLRERVAVAAALVCNRVWIKERFGAYRKKNCKDSIIKDFDVQQREVSARNSMANVRAIKVMVPSR